MIEKTELQKKYQEFIQEITLDDLAKMCSSGKIDKNWNLDKAWVVNYLGEEPEKQAEHLLDALVDSEVAFMIRKSPATLFKNIYAIKDYADRQDIIAEFADGIVDLKKLEELYPAESRKIFKLSSYVDEQLSMSQTYEKEVYDPLNFKGQQEKIDDLKRRVESGESTIGEVLIELGVIKEGEDYDHEKVNDIIDKLVNNKMTLQELEEKCNNNEISPIEIRSIVIIIEKLYPEVDKRLNEQVI